jgi:peroxiredoxin (alkyl hydroperoxide reductase subunit C)
MLEVGQVAPDFEVRDTEGQPVKLSDFRGKKNVLLLFYPFAFSRVCTTEFCQLRDENADLASDENLEVIGISTDPLHSLKAWKEQERYPNRFVSDFWPHGAVSQAYDAFQEQIGMSLRHAFLIDKEGVVRLVQRNETREARNQDEWRAKLKELS